MKFPNFNEEKKLQKMGYKLVAGLDEAGRGPLAGPVVAGAVVFLDSKFKIPGVNDSKKLSAKKREELYKILTNHKNVRWGVGIVSEKIIDKINILEATKLAMQRAIKDLGCNVDYLLVDGNFKIYPVKFRGANYLSGVKSKIPQKSIVKGDQKVYSISAASIIAKVTRDGIMDKYDKKYPKYGFKKHKGYPTKFHRKKIKELGLCKIHRRSFRSI